MKKRTVVIALSSILFLSGTTFGNGYTQTNLQKHIENAKKQEEKDKKEFEEKVKKLKKEQCRTQTTKREKPELTKGYSSKISAIFATLNHISLFNKGYEIAKGANGLYYIRLLTDETYKISN
ncbi:DUF5633 domain-containing protein [Sneathia sanguinegens]|uniref:DUF5633 domain-containing protein n=1 Tax=Sneathia sanguinegens TaxID=40543 RepID=A0ABT7HKW9_9FUSO|nr:DUF5633 domain-containing protein [Sneathia sanguinegens]MDK9581179.1 DUF5633 domain-containing protein [Sneathia sanguinegens]